MAAPRGRCASARTALQRVEFAVAGFGRRFIDVEPGELADEVLYQLCALDGFPQHAGTRVS